MLSSIIRLFLQGYLNLAISLSESVKNFDPRPQSAYMTFALAALLIISPLVFWVYLYVKYRKLRKPSMKLMLESLYYKIEMYGKRWAVAHTSLGLYRRLLFAATVVFFRNNTVFQVSFTLCQSQLMLTWLTMQQPMFDRSNNLIMIINEFFLHFLTACILLFSQMVPSARQRYDYGTAYLVFVLVNIVFNLAAIVYSIVVEIKKKIRQKAELKEAKLRMERRIQRKLRERMHALAA